MNQYHILIAEDEPETRLVLQKLCDQAGIAADFAQDGPEALQKYQQAAANGTRYDLIVLDASMPVLNGFEVAESIRTTDAGQLIVFMSALNSAMEKSRASLLGAAAYWEKPLAIMNFAELASDILRQAG